MFWLRSLEQDRAGFGADKAAVIGVLPTADMPASTTIEWSGYVRAAIVFHDYNKGGDGGGQSAGSTLGSKDNNFTVKGRGQLKVVGKTDTAVGEIGARVQVRANLYSHITSSAAVVMNEAWGWWAMTPELTIGGGYSGSLGNIGYGQDGACSCYYTDAGDVYTNPGDTAQMRLSWLSGPLSVAVAIENADGGPNGFGNHHSASGSSAFHNMGNIGFAAQVKFTGDSVSGEIGGAWRDTSGGAAAAPHGGHTHSTVTGAVDSYVVGAGLGFSLGEMASLSLAANMGRTNYDADFWDANALVSANLSDTVHAELGGGYKTYNFKGPFGFIPNRNVWSALAGLYYEPVSQLTIGLEAEYTDTRQGHLGTGTYKLNNTIIDLVTVYRF